MKMEKQNLEQHCVIKFCVKLNENAIETYEKLKRLMESMLYRGHEFLDGIKYFGCPWEYGRQTSFWKTLHIKNGQKFLQSKGSCKVWLTFDSQNDWQWVEFESPNCPWHFNRGIEQAENFCEAGSKKPHQQTKGKSKECVPGPSWTH